MFINWFKKRKY